MNMYRTWAKTSSYFMLVFVILLLSAREGAALQTTTVPEPEPRTIEEGVEEIFPCCRLDASAYPGIGTFGFENRMARSFTAWLGNDVAWWGNGIPKRLAICCCPILPVPRTCYVRVSRRKMFLFPRLKILSRLACGSRFGEFLRFVVSTRPLYREPPLRHWSKHHLE
ncbi:MAG: hypothetical protein FJ147_10045 [Deltaproteobacteria bacterium]|nr:hypothetical protein [Deltaproteobacteria bacterium]